MSPRRAWTAFAPGWKRARDRKALERAAERIRWRERERREELAQRLDEYGGRDDPEVVPRVD